MSAGLTQVSLESFRCFQALTFEPDPHVNVIEGSNASGKTSLLEAIFFLGRGNSFRASRAQAVIREGERLARVFASSRDDGIGHRIGVEISPSGVELRLDGQSRCTRAELAAAMPVQVLDPSVHALVQGPPEGRRRFFDWAVFHVEQGFLEAWQRYRRALQQRNAALRTGMREAVEPWDQAVAESGECVDAARRAFIERFLPVLERNAESLVGHAVRCAYSQGWPAGQGLLTALGGALERDLQLGNTSVGPHRADVRLLLRDKRARDRVSRGQEKLLVAALMCAQVELVSAALGRDVTLLVDEPAADLDAIHLARLMTALQACRAQLFVTSLGPSPLPVDNARTFHVEPAGLAPVV